MKSELEKLVGRYRELGIDRQLDYDKFYLYSIITHSTAIEGVLLRIGPDKGGEWRIVDGDYPRN